MAGSTGIRVRRPVYTLRNMKTHTWGGGGGLDRFFNARYLHGTTDVVAKDDKDCIGVGQMFVDMFNVPFGVLSCPLPLVVSS